VVTGYLDEAHGEMALNPDHSGQFESVTLRPQVTVTEAAMVERATALHHDVSALCFIARWGSTRRRLESCGIGSRNIRTKRESAATRPRCALTRS
jgi:organic hydroperoxide reductase OsmC/OhrA